MATVRQDSLSAHGEGTLTDGLATRLGLRVEVDFYTYLLLQGKGYNVRAGTISAPVVGDVVITDTAAEMAVAAASGLTLIPVFTNVSFNLAAATLFEAGGKSTAVATMSGTAFVPLPLRTFGKNGATATASSATAAVAAAGGVTVAAELATTTRRHWSWAQPIAAGAWPTWYDWQPLRPPVLVGPSCYYVQIGADTTGPSYFASFDYLEVASDSLI